MPDGFDIDTVVVWPDPDLGCFQLPDGSWGTPGCDICGDPGRWATPGVPDFDTTDFILQQAVVCIDGDYLCGPHTANREAHIVQDMLTRLEEEA